MEGGEGLAKKPPCRKKRRKASALKKEYGTREGENVRLETHSWHVKHMHMVNKYNFRIAEHCSDKGVRASHRSMVHGCLLSVSNEFECK